MLWIIVTAIGVLMNTFFLRLGKHEIQAFQEKCEIPQVKAMHWSTVKAKIVNEKNKLRQTLEKMERYTNVNIYG